MLLYIIMINDMIYYVSIAYLQFAVIQFSNFTCGDFVRSFPLIKVRIKHLSRAFLYKVSRRLKIESCVRALSLCQRDPSPDFFPSLPSRCERSRAVVVGRGPLPGKVDRFKAGLFSGSVQAALFSPYDRAFYLAILHNRRFLSRENFRRPFEGFPISQLSTA